MKGLLRKGLLILIAALLCVGCFGSAFCLYTINATPRLITLTPTMPNVYRLLGDWNGWTNTDANNMICALGVYTVDDVTVAAGDGFKIYDVTNDVYLAAIDSISPPHSGGGVDNIVLTKAGTYDFTFTPAGGVSVTADSYHYTFTMTHGGVSGGNAVIKAWIWQGSGNGAWADVTIESDTVYTATFDAAIDHCQIVRFPPNTEIAWNNQWNNTADIDLSGASAFGTSMW